MSFFQFSCGQDNIIDELRKTFNATPLSIPDAATQPLQIVAHRGKESVLWGPLQDILADDAAITLKAEHAEVAPVKIRKTGSFEAGFGFKILEGLLGGFGVEINPLKIVLKQAQELSLSFDNVRKKSIPIASLGKELAGKKIALQNPAMHLFTRPKRPFSMFVISSVLESNQFSIHLEKTIRDHLEVEAPVLAKLSDAGLKLDEQSANQQSIVFQGKKHLTFAFSALELLFDPANGHLRFGEVKILKRTIQGENNEIMETVPQETSFLQEGATALMGWNRKEAYLES